VHEFVRRLIGLLIEDVVAETGRRLAALAPHSADDVRHAPSGMSGFSPAVAEADGAIKDFLETRMYRHARVMRVMDDAAQVVRELFARYSQRAGALPAEWSEGLADTDEGGRARRIADFIAGMTDRYALAEHARLFDSTPELR
jgi:dGTPase